MEPRLASGSLQTSNGTSDSSDDDNHDIDYGSDDRSSNADEAAKLAAPSQKRKPYHQMSDAELSAALRTVLIGQRKVPRLSRRHRDARAREQSPALAPARVAAVSRVTATSARVALSRPPAATEVLTLRLSSDGGASYRCVATVGPGGSAAFVDVSGLAPFQRYFVAVTAEATAAASGGAESDAATAAERQQRRGRRPRRTQRAVVVHFATQALPSERLGGFGGRSEAAATPPPVWPAAAVALAPLAPRPFPTAALQRQWAKSSTGGGGPVEALLADLADRRRALLPPLRPVAAARSPYERRPGALPRLR